MVVQLEAESFIANLPPPQRLLCHEQLDKPGGVVAHRTIMITEAKPTHTHTNISVLMHGPVRELPNYHKICIVQEAKPLKQSTPATVCGCQAHVFRL